MLPAHRNFLRLGGICLLALQLLSSAQAAELQRHEFSEPHMGMLVRVVLYTADADSAKAGSPHRLRTLRALNAIFSDYDPTSELSRIVSNCWSRDSATSQAPTCGRC